MYMKKIRKMPFSSSFCHKTLNTQTHNPFSELDLNILWIYIPVFSAKGDVGLSLCWRGWTQSHRWESPVPHGHALVRYTLACTKPIEQTTDVYLPLLDVVSCIYRDFSLIIVGCNSILLLILKYSTCSYCYLFNLQLELHLKNVIEIKLLVLHFN